MAVLRPLLILFAISVVASARAADAPREGAAGPDLAIAGRSDVLVSTHSSTRFKAGAASDTFFLYGGPGSIQGKFEDASGLPLTAAQLAAEGWEFVDTTDRPTLWHRSTFNTANLGGHGAGNHGMWAGFSAALAPGWTTPPGYGNSWNARIEWTATVLDPSVGQTVGLDFVFNHDSEPAYDFLHVEYETAGSTVVVYSVDGSNQDTSGNFAAPGVQFAAQSPSPIVYAGDDYAGGTEIRIRLMAVSDGAWSDEDGLWDSDGFAQVDDITVTWSDGVGKAPQVSFEDFEGPGPYAWVPEKVPFVGYFGQVFAGMTDTDACRENATPVYGFMDDGTGPFNPTYAGTGTGGSTSVNWSYGIPGGWIVNHTGGLLFELQDLENELHTPVLAWDLPGPEDDGPQMVGARIRFSLWEHLPLDNAIFYQWSVKARDSATGVWTAWANRNFVYYGGGNGRWRNLDLDVSDLVVTPSGPDSVRLQLALRDLDGVSYWFSSTDATPSPVFDNVAFLKYRVGGPVIAAKSSDLFQDSFSQSGQVDASTESARDALDARLDMARDVSTGMQLVAGDSIVADITSIVPGHTVGPAEVRLRWALHRNPYFEDSVRANLLGFPGVVVEAGSGQNGWDVFTGEVVASQSTTSAGQVVPNRVFFDLPDQDFLYPGDVIQYHIEAEDSGGLISTLPADVTGFASADKSAYDSAYEVSALPTITAGGQPDLLVIDDRGHGDGRDELLSALGGEVGVDFDLYTVRAPTSGISNRIGSAGAAGRGHGAAATQLAGYSCILYEAGALDAHLLSDGTDHGGNDKGEDLGVLTAWHSQDTDRYLALFGDAIAGAHASAGTGSPAGDTFRTATLGVEFLDPDVRDEIGGSTVPLVTATGLVPGLAEDFVAYGGLRLGRSPARRGRLARVRAQRGGRREDRGSGVGSCGVRLPKGIDHVPVRNRARLERGQPESRRPDRPGRPHGGGPGGLQPARAESRGHRPGPEPRSGPGAQRSEPLQPPDDPALPPRRRRSGDRPHPRPRRPRRPHPGPRCVPRRRREPDRLEWRRRRRPRRGQRRLPRPGRGQRRGTRGQAGAGEVGRGGLPGSEGVPLRVARGAGRTLRTGQAGAEARKTFRTGQPAAP